MSHFFHKFTYEFENIMNAYINKCIYCRFRIIVTSVNRDSRLLGTNSKERKQNQRNNVNLLRFIGTIFRLIGTVCTNFVQFQSRKNKRQTTLDQFLQNT